MDRRRTLIERLLVAPSGFEPNAIIRGAQLTLVGAHRSLQNPELFNSEHYQQAAYAVLAGIGIRLVIAVPIVSIKLSLRAFSLLYPLDTVTWDDAIIRWLNFLGEYVLQAPLFLMTIMRYFVPTLDNLFMQSLNWVDITYIRKYKNENPDSLRDLYYPNLKSYGTQDHKKTSVNGRQSLIKFLSRYARRACLSLIIFALSYLPVVGRVVLPLASFYTFHRAVGLAPAALIFGIGFMLPRNYLVIFLQSYFSSRNLMRELLEPYFARVHFTSTERRNWFKSREGVLFGFALGFYTLIRIPLLGVLVYGIAEASTAYLITKITEPPPPPEQMRQYAISQQKWHNRHDFLSSNITSIDDVSKRKHPRKE